MKIFNILLKITKITLSIPCICFEKIEMPHVPHKDPLAPIFKKI